MDESKVMVVIPTYNEADNLPAMVAELLSLGIAGLGDPVRGRQLARRDRPGGRRPGPAATPAGSTCCTGRARWGWARPTVTGFRYALDHGAAFVVQMDADFSHSPEYIEKFVEAIQDCDVVIGSRYVSGGRLDERWSWWRYFLSWWANSIYTRLILGLRVKDTTAGFKCWRRATLEGIGLDRVRSNGYVFQVEMAYLTEKLGYRFCEIPIYFEDRRIGKSKMTVPVKIEAALRTWQIRWRHRRAKRSAVSSQRSAADS